MSNSNLIIVAEKMAYIWYSLLNKMIQKNKNKKATQKLFINYYLFFSGTRVENNYRFRDIWLPVLKCSDMTGKKNFWHENNGREIFFF